MCRSNIVSYYPTEGFVMLDQDDQALNNTPLGVKQKKHAVNMLGNYSVMIYSNEITSVENTLKKISLSETILNEFTSTYCDDKNDSFEMLF